jgi:hypothetical protein
MMADPLPFSTGLTTASETSNDINLLTIIRQEYKQSMNTTFEANENRNGSVIDHGRLW